MTEQVELIGGPLDGQKVTVAKGMKVFEHWQSGMLDALLKRPCVRVLTYTERTPGKFHHVLTEKRALQ